MIDDKPDGWYGKIMRILSMLLYAPFLALVAAFVCSMTVMIYIVAYVFPVVGMLFVALGVYGIVFSIDGAVVVTIAGVILAGFGGWTYDEYFVSWPGGMTPITQVPSLVWDRIGGLK